MRAIYPYMDDFWVGYAVRFPKAGPDGRPLVAPGAQKVLLRVASSLGRPISSSARSSSLHPARKRGLSPLFFVVVLAASAGAPGGPQHLGARVPGHHLRRRPARRGEAPAASRRPGPRHRRKVARRARARPTTTGEAGDFLTIAEAISSAGGHDPLPRSLISRPARGDAPLARHPPGLPRRRRHPPRRRRRAVGGDRGAIVLLLAERKATLAPVARELAAPGVAEGLRRALAPPLERPELFATAPDGTARRIEPDWTDGASFCFSPSLGRPGRHAIEVLGRGPLGPEIAALFFVDVGEKGKRLAAKRPPSRPPSRTRARSCWRGFKLAARRARPRPGRAPGRAPAHRAGLRRADGGQATSSRTPPRAG